MYVAELSTFAEMYVHIPANALNHNYSSLKFFHLSNYSLNNSNSPTSSWKPQFYFLSLWICSFQAPHICGIIRSMESYMSYFTQHNVLLVHPRLIYNTCQFSFLLKVDNTALYVNMHHIWVFNLLMNAYFSCLSIISNC